MTSLRVLGLALLLATALVDCQDEEPLPLPEEAVAEAIEKALLTKDDLQEIVEEPPESPQTDADTNTVPPLMDGPPPLPENSAKDKGVDVPPMPPKDVAKGKGSTFPSPPLPEVTPANFNKIVPFGLLQSKCLPALRAKMSCLASKLTTAGSIHEFKEKMTNCIVDKGKCEVTINIRVPLKGKGRHTRQFVDFENGQSMQDIFLPSEQNIASQFRQWRRVRECVTAEAPQLHEALSSCMSQKGYPKLNFARLELFLSRGLEKLAMFLDTPSMIQQSCREPQAAAECVSDLLHGVDIASESAMIEHVCNAHNECPLDTSESACQMESQMLGQLRKDLCNCASQGVAVQKNHFRPHQRWRKRSNRFNDLQMRYERRTHCATSPCTIGAVENKLRKQQFQR